MSESFNESGGNGTVFKPIGLIAQIIEQTSTGDLLLFMIAQDRKNRADARAVPENNFVEIGKNN